jgi:hypothetical protein
MMHCHCERLSSFFIQLHHQSAVLSGFIIPDPDTMALTTGTIVDLIDEPSLDD